MLGDVPTSVRRLSDEETAWAIADAFGAYPCPRGCGELIYASPVPGDDPDERWEVPFGSNETRRHRRESCDEWRASWMLARVYPTGRPEEAVWDRSLRFRLAAKGDTEVRGLGSPPDPLRASYPMRHEATISGGRAVTRQRLLPERNSAATFQNPGPAITLLTVEAWPVLDDDDRWCHTILGKLALTDVEHEPGVGTVSSYRLLETGEGWLYKHQYVTRLPDAPPWWATVDHPRS